MSGIELIFYKVLVTVLHSPEHWTGAIPLENPGPYPFTNFHGAQRKSVQSLSFRFAATIRGCSPVESDIAVKN